MLQFKEKMGSIFCMDEKENVQYEVTEPAVLFDKETYTMHRIGNKEVVEQYFEECIEKCKKAGIDLYEQWLLMDLPKDAEVMDRILQSSGYIEIFLKENHIELNNIK